MTYAKGALVILITIIIGGNLIFFSMANTHQDSRGKATLLTGSFIIASDYVNDRDGYDALLKEMKDMEMNKVVLHSIGEVHDDGTYERTVSDEVLGWMLSDAANLSMDVFIGLFASNQSDYWNNPVRDVLIQQDNLAVQEIESKYGSRENFMGYYVEQEVFVGVHHLEILDDIFAPLINDLHHNTSKPIMVSGYMDPADYGNTPDDIENWIHDFIYGGASNEGCGVDIFLLQDGVGSFDNNVLWNHGYNIYNYFVSAKNGASPNTLWADVELFQWNYIKNFSSDNNWYNPANAIRVNAQIYDINQAGIDEKITWINQHHMTEVGKNYHQREARHMYRGFMALYYWGNYYGDPNYYEVQKPSSKYPDTGGMLFDDVVGEKWYDEWVGWNKSQGNEISIIIDLGEEKPITDVTAIVRSEKSAAIYYPTSMKVEISDDNVTYSLLDTFTNPYEDTQNYSKADFWISEDEVHYARYVKITFTLGGWWFFLTELEVYGVQQIDEFPHNVDFTLALVALVLLLAFVGKKREKYV